MTPDPLLDQAVAAALAAPAAPPPNPFVLMGLGRNFGNGPVQWTIDQLAAVDGSTLFLIRFETTAGQFGIILDATAMEVFERTVHRARSGLIVPGA